MKRPFGRIAAALMLLFGFAPLTGSLYAQSSFVYTNNEPVFGAPNSVSAFSVGPNGALTPVAGSPFLTGGGGIAGTFGFVLQGRIVVTTTPGNFLYVSNDASNSVSGFSIDTVTGVLTPIPGSPFATGAVNSFGISLAVTPGGQFLYAGNSAFPASISVFGIASNGALTSIPGSPVPVSFVGGKVTPDGKFLALAQGNLAMLSIGSNGALTPVPGSPFSVSGGNAEGLDVNCASNLLFASTNLGASPGEANVLNIASNGVLTPIAGSPFRFSGSNSVVDALSPDDQRLFVGNFSSETIASLSVAPGGSLTEVSGSPFSTSPLPPFTMATNKAGTLLYVAAQGTVIGFDIDSNGALSLVPGSTVFTGGSLTSVAVFPPKTCQTLPVPTISSISPTSAIAGGATFTLTVNGTNFVSGSTVNFNGNARTTTFVSATQMTAAILASDIATAGTFNVTVTNPSGGGTSNAVSFTIVTPEEATQTVINSVNALFSQGALNGGQDNSLVVKLQHAINGMNAGKNDAAIRRLDSFINEVNDLLSSGVLSPSQAASLVSAAQSVIAAL